VTVQKKSRRKSMPAVGFLWSRQGAKRKIPPKRPAPLSRSKREGDRDLEGQKGQLAGAPDKPQQKTTGRAVIGEGEKENECRLAIRARTRRQKKKVGRLLDQKKQKYSKGRKLTLTKKKPKQSDKQKARRKKSREKGPENWSRGVKRTMCPYRGATCEGT